MSEAEEVNAAIPSASDLRKLLELHAKASSGPWTTRPSGWGDSNDFWITTWWREHSIAGKEGDGPIAHVSGERTVTHRGLHNSEPRFTKKKIKTARDDAELICAAVNAIPGLCAALLGPGMVDESAWLIEFPADKYGPVRYFAIGEPPVISASDATRFSRQQDAEAYMRAHAIKGGKATEHAWSSINPARHPTQEQG